MVVLLVAVLNPLKWALLNAPELGFTYDKVLTKQGMLRLWPSEGTDLEELQAALDEEGLPWEEE